MPNGDNRNAVESTQTNQYLNRRNLLKIVGAPTSIYLAGCSGQGTRTTTTEPETDRTSTTETDTAQPQEGGTLKIGIESKPSGLDPHRTATSHSWAVIFNICETLLTFKDGQLAGRLAEDWTISSDGTEYTFKLKDATFHPPVDRKVTADDVVYSFERMLNPETIMAADLSVIDNIVAVDEKTVRFELKKPFGPFLSFLVPVPRVVVPKEAVRNQGGDLGDFQKPIGTGAFTFKERAEGDHITLKAFDDFHEENQPHLDTIKYMPIPDDDSRVLSLRSGDIGFARKVPGNKANSLKKHEGTKLALQKYARWGGLFINNSKEPWSNPAVRRAVAHLVDRRTVPTAGLFGFGEATWQPFSPNSFWNIEDLKNAREKNVEKANQILADAGNPLEGTTLQIQTESGIALNQTMGKVIEANLSSAGIDVNLNKTTHSTLVGDFVKGNYTASTFSLPHKVDPDRYFYNFLHPDSPHYFHYGDDQPDVERMRDLIITGRQEVNREKRKDIYTELMELINKNVPFVSMAFQHYVWGLRQNLNNYDPWLLPFNRFWSVWKEEA